MAFIFVSPLLGFLLGVAADGRGGLDLPPRRRRRASTAGSGGCSWSRPALYSLGHGGNDAQKTIGIIWMLLIAAGYDAATDASAADLGRSCSCYTAIALGTMFGGWRIVKTMGQKITKLKPVGGFCAETGGAHHAVPRHRAGHPGVDHAHHHRRHRRRRLRPQRSSAVRWGVAGNIVWAWIFTIPASAFVAGIACVTARALF